MLTKLRNCAILGVLIISLPVSAQAPLNEPEKLKMEIINLKQQLSDSQFKLASCQFTVNKVDIQSHIQSLKQAIESTRPGFEYDMNTGVFKEKSNGPGANERK